MQAAHKGHALRNTTKMYYIFRKKISIKFT